MKRKPTFATPEARKLWRVTLENYDLDEHHPDDLAFAILGRRFFKRGQLKNIKELRECWRTSPSFRAAVIAYAAKVGRTEIDIYVLNN